MVERAVSREGKMQYQMSRTFIALGYRSETCTTSSVRNGLAYHIVYSKFSKLPKFKIKYLQ